MGRSTDSLVCLVVCDIVWARVLTLLCVLSCVMVPVILHGEQYYPPHQPTWSNYINPKVAEREYVEAPYSYSFPHKSAIPPHMIDGYDMNKHVLDA